MTKHTKGPKFLRFLPPLIKALKALGNSGNSSEVVDYVIDMMGISEEELEETLKSGASRVKNQIAWARMYLVKAGYMKSSERGLWRLSEKGLNLGSPTGEEAYRIFKNVQEQYRNKGTENDNKPKKGKEEDIIDTEDLIDEKILEEEDHKEKLLEKLQSLPADGFERLCQMLLRESGFKKVKVIGKSGDGGIDGEGILEINPLVSFKVVFQAKKYKNVVSSPKIRDFRGAMQGRAEKGIIITTGRFTRDAKQEAVRDGVTPIELIDGDDLVRIFEEKELGLKPKTVYDIDEEFFEEYRQKIKK